MPSYHTLYFHALGAISQVRHLRDDTRWPERLSDLMGASASLDTPARAPSVSLTVIRSDRQGYWRIQQRLELGQRFAWLHEDALLRDVEWRLYAASAEASPAPLMLHAGAAARAGLALLLPGSSGSGKTTLTYALATRGWQTLTDDLLALNTASDDSGGALLAYPCERCGHVSALSLNLLSDLGVSLEGPVAGLIGYHRPRVWAEAAPVGYVIAPRYEDGASCAAMPLTQAETAALLMQASFTQGHVDYHLQWQAAARVAAQTRGWRLTYGRLSDALDTVDQLTALSAGETRVGGEE